MDELKPCPFCGSTEFVDGQPPAQVLCFHCVAQGWRKDWNKRPIEDALRAESAELRRANDAFAELMKIPEADAYAQVAALRAENERLQEELGGLKDGEPCACRWDHGNEKARQMCELHEAWEAAIHDWAARAKIAEAENTALRARAEAAEKELAEMNDLVARLLGEPAMKAFVALCAHADQKGES